MTYRLQTKEKCLKELKKAYRKNPKLKNIINKKTEEILKNPYRFKPLKNKLFGKRRVHILKSFVLQYEIDENNRIVTFISFEHHDKAYKR